MEPIEYDQREYEHALREAFYAALADFAELAAPLWRIGDGDGAYVIDALREEVEFVQPGATSIGRRATPPAPSKAKIGGVLRTQVYERDGYRCVICESWRDLSCDHIIPESLGGPTTLENLQTMCRPCNSRKGTKVT